MMISRRPISLCMISKGEPTLARAIASTLPLIDEVVIVASNGKESIFDSLSKSAHPSIRLEGDEALVEVKTGRKIPLVVEPFTWVDDFSVPRNRSLELASNEACFWIDSDDQLVGAPDLRAWFDKQPWPQTTLLRYDYEKNEGKKTLSQFRERILPKNRGRFVCEIHEVFTTEKPCRAEMGPSHIYVDHDLDRSKPESKEKMERNLRYLENHVRKCNDAGTSPDRRLFYHYILTLFSLGKFAEGIKSARWFIAGEPAGIHKARVYLAIADAYYTQGRIEDARGCSSAAIGQDPSLLLPYVQLAELAFKQKRFDEALYWFYLAYEAPPQPKQVDYQLWRPEIEKPDWTMATVCAMSQGDWDRALQYARRANWRDMALDIQKRKEDFSDAQACSKILSRKDLDASSRRSIAMSLPVSMREIPEIGRYLLPEIPKDRLSITIHCGEEGMSCGKDGSRWGPHSLDEGIGGSEEAVIRISKELASHGAHVELYGPFRETLVHEGVHYIQGQHYDPKRIPSVFVAWRYPGLCRLADRKTPRLLWSHDALTSAQFDEVPDAVWGLSDYHVSLLRGACPDAAVFWRTGNGIPYFGHQTSFHEVYRPALPDQPNWKQIREPGRCFYASSPDRGLDILLGLWPSIVEGVKQNAGPTPSLHIYYGFNIWWMEHEKADPNKKALRESIEARIKELEPLSVVWHGAVGQPELHEAILRSNVWLYPTRFNEISCITAMKAQALGAIPVCSRFAALDETVQFGDRFGSVDRDDIEDHKKEFVEAAVLRICSPDEDERARMMQWANVKFPWKIVAKSWIDWIEEWLHERKPDRKPDAERGRDDADRGDRNDLRLGNGDGLVEALPEPQNVGG